MKPSQLATLSFLFLLFFSNSLLGARSASHEPLGARSASHEPLFDADGNKVESTLYYYVVSAIWGAGGGGLSLHSGRNSLCPLDVVQESSDRERGIRINFSPFDNSTVVRESTDLNIKFVTLITRCNEQPVWKVDNYDDSRGKWFITIGGKEGNPGAHTLQNWFKLERIGSNAGIYKIVHCPSVCESCVKLCSNVGVSYVDGARRLVLVPDGEPAFAVVLFLAKERSD